MWCLGGRKGLVDRWAGGQLGWRDSGSVGGQRNWETGTWTNVDSVLLMVMVEKRAASVVWYGDGQYQLESGGA